MVRRLNEAKTSRDLLPSLLGLWATHERCLPVGRFRSCAIDPQSGSLSVPAVPGKMPV